MATSKLTSDTWVHLGDDPVITDRHHFQADSTTEEPGAHCWVAYQPNLGHTRLSFMADSFERIIAWAEALRAAAEAALEAERDRELVPE